MALLKFSYTLSTIQPITEPAIMLPVTQEPIAIASNLSAPSPTTTVGQVIPTLEPIQEVVSSPQVISSLSNTNEVRPPYVIAYEPVVEASKIDLSGKIAAIISPVEVTVPIFSSIGQAILLPSFSLNQTPISKEFPVLETKFNAMEQIGLSNSVPEILMMTRFKPLFKEGVSTRLTSPTGNEQQFEGLSAEGQYFDIQIQLRTLMFENIVNFIRDMKQHPELDDHFEKQRKGYKLYIERVDKNINTLYSIIKKMDALRNAFFLSPKRLYFLNAAASVIPSAKTSTTFSGLFSFTGDVSSYQSLLTKLGYNSKLVENYSSTKLYLQTLYEIRLMTESYSAGLVNLSKEGRGFDFDPVTIKKAPKAEISPNFKSFNTAVMTIDRDFDRSKNYKLVKPVMAGIATSLSFTDSQKMAWMCHLLAKEYRFSKALGNDATIQLLANSYDYQVRESNPTVLDAIFGNIGNSIVEFPKNSTLALASAAQIPDENAGVLPFESRFIDSGGSTYTPGSAYIVDPILSNGEINTNALNAYVKVLNSQVTAAGKVFEHFDLFSTGKGVGEGLSSFLDDHLDDPTRMLTWFENTLNAASGDYVGGAVFNYAKTNESFKNALFTYVYLKASDPFIAKPLPPSSTPATPVEPPKPGEIATLSPEVLNLLVSYTDPHNDEAYVNDIATLLRDNLIVNQGEGADALSKMITEIFTDKTVLISSHEDVKAALRSGKSTMILGKIVEMFKFIVNTFDSKKALVGNKTKFSGLTSQVMCAILFEGLLAMVDDRFKWAFSAKFDTGGIFSYTLKKRNLGLFGSLSAFDGVATAHDLLKKEKKLIHESLALLLTSLVTLRDTAQSTLNNINASKNVVDDIAKILRKKELMPLLMNEAQIVLLRQQLDAIQTNMFDNFDANEDSVLAVGSAGLSLVTDDSIISSDVRKVLFDNFSFSRYLSNNGHNLKVMTVGIPWGMTKTLKDKIDIKKLSKNQRNTRQSDIVRVNVFKSDMEFQDVVFKPISFLFELSRFVPRSGLIEAYKTGGSMENIANAMKTRDYSPDIIDANDTSKLDHEEYSFLTNAQKKEIINNHLQSYLLELYIKLMTGVSVSENDFSIDETNVKNIKADFVTKIFGKKLIDFTLANAGGIDALGSMDLKVMQSVAIPKISPLQTVKLDHFVKTVASFTKLNTVFSDGLNVAQKLLTPKVFERTFNLPIDPDDFEINVEETLKKELGKESFEALLAQGRIVEATKQTQINNFAAGVRYKLRDRSKKENHLIFEKYFVTIETLDEPASTGVMLPLFDLIKPIVPNLDYVVGLTPIQPAPVPPAPTYSTPLLSFGSSANITSAIGSIIQAPRVI